jgi:hypothetical protein
MSKSQILLFLKKGEDLRDLKVPVPVLRNKNCQFDPIILVSGIRFKGIVTLSLRDVDEGDKKLGYHEESCSRCTQPQLQLADVPAQLLLHGRGNFAQFAAEGCSP